MKIKYSFDDIVIKDDNKLTALGWAAGTNPESVILYTVIDEKKNAVPIELKRKERTDVSRAVYGEVYDNPYGFQLSFQMEKGHRYKLILSDGNARKKITITKERIWASHKKQSLVKLLYSLNTDNPFSIRSSSMDYDTFRKIRNVQLEMEMKKKPRLETGDSPTFSIVIPLYATPEKYLRELIESIEKQTYQKYEVCFADGSPEDSLRKIIKEYQKGNHRIRYQYLNGNRGISGNTNAALEMATGDYIVLCDHDDLLAENALYELAKAVKENPKCECIYSDEDKVDETETRYFDPHFKPDYNIDLLCSVNYICHLYAVKRSIVEETGGFREEYDGAQDHDFILRTTEKAKKTVHIPKVLYHWRTHMGSTSENPESKLYAYEAGKKAIKAHYERVWPEIEIEKIEDGISLGIYHTYFKVKEELVSVIIPNKDHTEDLDKAVRSLIERGSWKNLEFIIVENNSEEEKTFEYYERIQKEYPQVKVVRYEGGFNYSRINNFGVKYAKGRYILLMNNDVELINPDSIREMVGYCQREDVGIVGCRLLYEDDTIQHAGVIVGIQGIADHAFKGKAETEPVYFSRAMIPCDYSAVTAAVLMTKRDVYESVDGLDETFEVAFNDIDFCLRVRETGKLVVYNPYASFHHYESKSRGLEDTEEKQKRFRKEIIRFARRYEKFMEAGDPMYNPNFSIARNDYALRNLYVDKVGQPYYYGRELKALYKEEEKASGRAKRRNRKNKQNA